MELIVTISNASRYAILESASATKSSAKLQRELFVRISEIVNETLMRRIGQHAELPTFTPAGDFKVRAPRSTEKSAKAAVLVTVD